MTRRSLALLFLTLLLSPGLLGGCAGTSKYASAPVGKFEGKVRLRWVGEDQFVFEPDPASPFKFIRANGDVIQPQAMFTDGGSIPRILWALPGYSPWGCGAAFVIHDWLFVAKHCQQPIGQVPANRVYDVNTAADTMSECIKTLMVTGLVRDDPLILNSMDLAVRTQIARDAWEKGKCVRPPREDAPTFDSALHGFVRPEMLRAVPLQRKVREQSFDFSRGTTR